MGKPVVVPYEQQMAAVRRYLAGASVRDVAEREPVGASTVARWIKTHAPGQMRSPTADTMARRRQGRQGGGSSARQDAEDRIARETRERLALFVPRGTDRHA